MDLSGGDGEFSFLGTGGTADDADDVATGEGGVDAVEFFLVFGVSEHSDIG